MKAVPPPNGDLAASEGASALKVLFTVDTEIWCGGWDNLDEKFSAAFRRYVYGPTPRGNYGLPVTMEILNDHGLTGVFFIEPLFATRFGTAPLQELVGLVQEAGQEVQLHLHTEWVDESLEPLVSDISEKRQNLRLFSRPDQAKLIAAGYGLLKSAGAGPINAFRAGNYGLNHDTLLALGDNGIAFDSSYNAAAAIGVADVAPGRMLTQPSRFGTVVEYPVTVYRDRGPNSLRHVQLNACSFEELRRILESAADGGWDSVVIVSHNFELLNKRKDRPDPIVVGRFRQLCRYLEQHNDKFNVVGFRDLEAGETGAQPAPVASSASVAYKRAAQQLVRRAFG